MATEQKNTGLKELAQAYAAPILILRTWRAHNYVHPCLHAVLLPGCAGAANQQLVADGRVSQVLSEGSDVVVRLLSQVPALCAQLKRQMAADERQGDT